MPPTPIWHAPLLAAFVGGVALVMNGPTAGWTVVGVIIGGVACVTAFVDQARRQRVKPRRLRKPKRLFWFNLVIVAVTFALLRLWGLVEWPSTLGAQLRRPGWSSRRCAISST